MGSKSKSNFQQKSFLDQFLVHLFLRKQFWELAGFPGPRQKISPKNNASKYEKNKTQYKKYEKNETKNHEIKKNTKINYFPWINLDLICTLTNKCHFEVIESAECWAMAWSPPGRSGERRPPGEAWLPACYRGTCTRWGQAALGKRSQAATAAMLEHWTYPYLW